MAKEDTYFHSLRKKANEIMARFESGENESSAAEVKQLIHELQVHQIELQIQNEDMIATQQSLQKSRDSFANFFNLVPVGYLVLNSDGIIKRCNLTFCEMLSSHLTELMHKSLLNLLDGASQRVFAARFPSFYKRPEGKSLELRIQHKHISLNVILSGRIIEDDAEKENKEHGLMVSVVDITERKRSEEQLVESELRFRSLVESHTGAVFLIDENKRLSAVFGAIFEHYGIERSNYIGKTLVEIFGADHYKYHLDKLNRAFTGEKVTYVWQLETDSGPFHFQIALNPLIEINIVRGVVGIASDVTDIEETNAELTRTKNQVEKERKHLKVANENLKSFAYAVSHDLKSPIRYIKGFSSILVEEFKHLNQEEIADLCNHINDSCIRMEQIVDSILQFSRSSYSKLDLEEVDLTELAKMISRRMFRSSIESNITWEIQENMKCICDSKLMSNVLENLFSNAVKFSQHNENPVIEFGKTVESGVTRYFVRDNGVGFDNEDAEDLFKPFTRLHNDGQFEGTGIGMATVKRIIERHQGTITATSEPGKGAVFYFTLGN